jgi:hypothetical protein
MYGAKTIARQLIDNNPEDTTTRLKTTASFQPFPADYDEPTFFLRTQYDC